MESYDIRYGGKRGVLYISEDGLRVSVPGGEVVVPPGDLLSCSVYGRHRILIVCSSGRGRSCILLRITGAPAARAAEGVLGAAE